MVVVTKLYASLLAQFTSLVGTLRSCFQLIGSLSISFANVAEYQVLDFMMDRFFYAPLDGVGSDRRFGLA